MVWVCSFSACNFKFAHNLKLMSYWFHMHLTPGIYWQTRHLKCHPSPILMYIITLVMDCDLLEEEWNVYLFSCCPFTPWYPSQYYSSGNIPEPYKENYKKYESNFFSITKNIKFLLRMSIYLKSSTYYISYKREKYIIKKKFK